jgi:hypothetical protein
MPAANRGYPGGSRHVRLDLFHASVVSSVFCGARKCREMEGTDWWAGDRRAVEGEMEEKWKWKGKLEGREACSLARGLLLCCFSSLALPGLGGVS